MSRIIRPPSAQEMSAAGPAAVDASSAPKSQPEPMIEPTLANSSPTTPTWRLSCVCSVVEEDSVSVDMCTIFHKGSGTVRPRLSEHPPLPGCGEGKPGELGHHSSMSHFDISR